jgi:hypothetical protein
VDNEDNIVHDVELASNVGVSGAKTYFLGVKKTDKKEFNKLWRVMTKESHTWLKEYTQKSSYRGIKWWEEDKKITDEELK